MCLAYYILSTQKEHVTVEQPQQSVRERSPSTFDTKTIKDSTPVGSPSTNDQRF